MNQKTPTPGISRSRRMTDEGLARLQLQLEKGQRLSSAVRSQWIKRYGEKAKQLLITHNQYQDSLEEH